MYTIGKLRTSAPEDIERHCKDLAMFLQVSDEKYVCECNLSDDLMISPWYAEILRMNYTLRTEKAFPNLSVGIRTILIFFTSAGAESLKTSAD